jgi:hypothetical protein
MNTPHISEQEICLYVDALKLDKTDHLPQNLVDHVSTCMECKTEIMRLYDVLRNDDYPRAGDHPSLGPLQRGESKPIPLMYRIAAALVLLLGAGLVAYFVFVKTSHEPAHSAQSVIVDTAGAGQKQDTQATLSIPKNFAANFTPSPNLEDLVGGNVRGASVTVESPENGQAITGKMVFRWRSSSKGPFTVTIRTNKEEEVFRITTDRQMALCDKRLDPGLYYWTLLEDGELVHVGKFVVPLR